MLVGIFALLSLAAAVIYGLAAHPAPGQLWLCALIFVLGILALSVLFLLGAAIVSLFIPNKWPREKQNALCRFYLAWGGGMLCTYCRVKTHVTGMEKLPTDSRFLMVCNHRSAFDPLSLFFPLRRYNLAYVSKPENLALPVVGRIALGSGCLPIRRGEDREALRSILAAVDYLKRDICSICIYPEGTRSKTGELLPFHHGSFKIAQRANVPLVICACSGSEQVKKNMFLRTTHVYLDVLEVVDAAQVRAMSTAELSDHARERIEKALAEREGKA